MPTGRHGGNNSGNARKHEKLVADINELIKGNFSLECHDGKNYALCLACNGAFSLGRIPQGKLLSSAKRCAVIAREGHHGGRLLPVEIQLQVAQLPPMFRRRQV